MRLVRWAATRRVLTSALVRADFSSHADEILLSAFTTDSMDVGEHGGSFSVKLVTRGEERYRIGRRDVLLPRSRCGMPWHSFRHTPPPAWRGVRRAKTSWPAQIHAYDLRARAGRTNPGP